MKKRFVTFFMACLMAFSCTAFAAETSGEISPRTDGYTYWDLKKTKTSGKRYDPYRIVISDWGGRGYEHTVSCTFEEEIEIVSDLELKEAMAALVGITIGKQITESVNVNGTFGGPNANPNLKYALRVRPVFNIYSIKGKQYQRIDGVTYEIDSFGYEGDKKAAKYAYKFSHLDVDDTYKVS